MAVSSTSFSERVTRINKRPQGQVQLYAGEGASQNYKAEKLICAKPKASAMFWGAITMGAVIGTIIGYLFQTKVGVEMFFSTPFAVLFTYIKADPTTAAICSGMILGPVASIGFLIFSRTRNRLSQFWGGYLCGMIGVNVTTWWAFYLTIVGA